METPSRIVGAANAESKSSRIGFPNVQSSLTHAHMGHLTSQWRLRGKRLAFVEFFVSDRFLSARHPLGYLLLRDGHAVPLLGISPDDIKDGAKHRVPHPDADPIGHRRCLNAIVDCLGFAGDFGSFLSTGWPDFNAFLRRHGCGRRVGAFPVDHGGCIDLHFNKFDGPRPRQLVDRIFLAPAAMPKPKRVFLGYGVDWSAWDSGDGYRVPPRAIATVRGDPETAPERAEALFSHRDDLMRQWGFLDDKLVSAATCTQVAKSYWPLGSDVAERKRVVETVDDAVRAFRAVFDCQAEGWVDVLPYNERLVVLRTCDGGWDVVWRGWRDEAPPTLSALADDLGFSPADLPHGLKSESDRRREIHFRQDVWDEHEEHEAEQAFYDRGGSMLSRRQTSDADVRYAWLRDRGTLPELVRANGGDKLPVGFRRVLIHGKELAVSEMITVGSFRRMLAETGNGGRRNIGDEPWQIANDQAPEDTPVGASWSDAQAYCAWRERVEGVSLRLLTRVELRFLRPAFSSHHERLAGGRDFPWEHFPPRPSAVGADQSQRIDVPSALVWSEPRFIPPEADMPEFAVDPVVTAKSRKRWILDFPPRAAWRNPLPIVQHEGLDFIDAWDAYEWCQERGWVSGRFWEGPVGAESWGAYKNVKVTFRLVWDLEG
jgi:hypothetical protein